MSMQTTDQWGSLLPAGLGNDQQALQATAAMRQSPWYQDWAKKNNLQFEGDQYGNAKLNDAQQQDLYNQALQHGIGLNNKYDQIDENGQISEAHHKLRNTLIAAAIAGAAATGLGAAGIGPMSGLFGAGTAAAGGASAAAPAIADLGAVNGAMIGGAAGIPSLAGATALSTIPELGALSAENLPGYLSTEGIFNSLPGAVAGPGIEGMSSAAAEGGPGSIFSKLFKNPKSLGDLSSILGPFSSGEKANRVVASQMADQYNKDMLSAQTGRNETESDALKKLAQTGYLLNGHSGYTPGSVQLNGQTRALPDFGFGYTAPSDAQKAGATSLQAQLGDRLKPGGTYTPIKPQMDPGLAENIGSYGGAALGGVGSVLNALNPNKADDSNYGDIGRAFLNYFKK